jgi:hypothetical protein
MSARDLCFDESSTTQPDPSTRSHSTTTTGIATNTLAPDEILKLARQHQKNLRESMDWVAAEKKRFEEEEKLQRVSHLAQREEDVRAREEAVLKREEEVMRREEVVTAREATIDGNGDVDAIIASYAGASGGWHTQDAAQRKIMNRNAVVVAVDDEESASSWVTAANGKIYNGAGSDQAVELEDTSVSAAINSEAQMENDKGIAMSDSQIMAWMSSRPGKVNTTPAVLPWDLLPSNLTYSDTSSDSDQFTDSPKDNVPTMRECLGWPLVIQSESNQRSYPASLLATKPTFVSPTEVTIKTPAKPLPALPSSESELLNKNADNGFATPHILDEPIPSFGWSTVSQDPPAMSETPSTIPSENIPAHSSVEVDLDTVQQTTKAGFRPVRRVSGFADLKKQAGDS